MRTNLSLRLLLADKDKEIEQLKKELTEEKNAYIKMYNMYVEKDNIINEAIEYMDRRDLEWGSDEHNKMMGILKGVDKE